MVNIGCCIVLYNRRAVDSTTIKALRNQSFFKRIVVDNSTDQAICRFNTDYFYGNNEFEYICMYKNIGLSRAYNLCIKSSKECDYLSVFDDDTIVPTSYLSSMRDFLSANSCDLAMPVVKVGSQIISPCRKTLLSFAPVHSLQQIGLRFSGINSGLCVNCEYAEQHPFNERLFVDYVDHDYFDRAFSDNASISINGKLELQQNLSLYQEQVNFASSRLRLDIFEKDCLEYYSSSYLGSIYSHLLVIKRRICLNLKFITNRAIN